MIAKNRSKSLNPTLVLVIAYMTLLISFKSSNQWSDLPIGNELFWWVFQTIFFVLILKIKSVFSNLVSDKNLLLVKLILIWNVICIIRGAFTADNYWEWKNLIATTFFLLLPLLVFVTNSFLAIQIIMKTWFKYGLFLYLLFSPFIWGDGVGKFLMPFTFLLLFFPIISFKWRVISVIVIGVVIIADITARSNLIKFFVPLCIGLLLYFRAVIPITFLNSLRIVLLSVPFFLFFLAISNVFNIFKIQEYFSGEYNVKSNQRAVEADEESLLQDSRTFLYVEVLESALKHEYVVFGRTPARGNDSAYFGEFNKLTLGTGKLERFANEVSILNIFTWLGVVGVVLYFLVFVKASYLAINKSNNFFMKLIGLNIAFRWVYGWVEDFSQFDLSNFFLWIMFGMCFSPTFRNMTDNEMKMWFRGIFEKKKPVVRNKRFNAIVNQNQLKLE